MEPNANFSTQNSFTVIQLGLNCLIENISPELKNDTLFTLDIGPHTYTHTCTYFTLTHYGVSYRE